MWSPNFISSHPILMVYICACHNIKIRHFQHTFHFRDNTRHHFAAYCRDRTSTTQSTTLKKTRTFFFNTELSWEGHLSNKKPHCQTLPKLKRSWGGGKDDGVSDEGVFLASFEELDSGVLYFENVSSAFSAAGKTKNKDGVRNVKVKINWEKISTG